MARKSENGRIHADPENFPIPDPTGHLAKFLESRTEKELIAWLAALGESATVTAISERNRHISKSSDNADQKKSARTLVMLAELILPKIMGAGDPCAILGLGMLMGMLDHATYASSFSIDIRRGMRILQGARKGHTLAQGTEEEKYFRFKKYVQEFAKVWKAGESSREWAYKKAGSNLGVSAKTIKRAVALADRMFDEQNGRS